MNAFEWDREKIKQVLQELSKLPDWDTLPMPEDWGKLYDVPVTPAKIIDLKSYLKKNKESRIFDRHDKYEVREPASGGIREVKEEEPMTLMIETKSVVKDENGNEILIPLSQTSAPSTESSSSTQPVSQEQHSTNVSLASHDGSHTVPSSLRFDV